jgi:hypothetical protein
MRRTIDISVSTRTKQYVVAGLVTLWAFVLVFGAVAGFVVQDSPAILLPLLAVLWLTVVLLWVERTDDSDDGSAWDHIPRWQYGRFSESGGLTKAQQEDTLPDDK